MSEGASVRKAMLPVGFTKKALLHKKPGAERSDRYPGVEKGEREQGTGVQGAGWVLECLVVRAVKRGGSGADKVL